MEKYRRGVGAFILNKSGKVFIGQRCDVNNAWQMPQGGVDNDDASPEDAVKREVYEEIGIKKDKLEIIAHTKPLKYRFPAEKAKKLWDGSYIGQEQIWFAMNFLGNESDINLKNTSPQEFKEYNWVDYNELTNVVVDFKYDMYKEIINQFKNLKII